MVCKWFTVSVKYTRYACLRMDHLSDRIFGAVLATYAILALPVTRVGLLLELPGCQLQLLLIHLNQYEKSSIGIAFGALVLEQPMALVRRADANGSEK